VRAVVVYKWSRNAADALVRADGSIDWRNAKMSPGEDDPAALAAALRLIRGGDDELVGLTIGDGDASWALARGVASTWSVEDLPALADNGSTAAVLAAAVRRIGGVDVVVIGDSRQEPGVAAAVAGRLAWSVVLGAQTVEAVDGRLHVTRRVADVRQTVVVPTPAVIGIAAESDLDRAPGMKELLAARKRPVNRIGLADLGVTAGDVQTLGCRRPETAPARVFAGDPAQSAAQFVSALRAEGVL